MKKVLDMRYLFCYNLNIGVWLKYYCDKAIVLLGNNDMIRYHKDKRKKEIAVYMYQFNWNC